MGRPRIAGQPPVNSKAYQRAYQQAYYEDPEKRAKRAAYLRAYYRRNTSASRTRSAEWRRSPKGRKYHAVREHLRRREQADPEVMAYGLMLMDDPCSYCGGVAESLDHIESVALGGDSEWGNLTASCRSCNSSKSTKSLLEFLGSAKEE